MSGSKGLTVKEISVITNGSVVGNAGKKIIKGANTLDTASGTEIAFFANPKYEKKLLNTKAGCVLVPRDYKVKLRIPAIKVSNPEEAFRKVLLGLFGDKVHPFKGISKKSAISKNALIKTGVKIGDYVTVGEKSEIGSKSVIYPNVYIGREVKIGSGCIIYPNVMIDDKVTVGNNVIIQAGSVIGSDGFGYATEGGIHKKIPQIGSVVLKDNVEVGSNVSIDRGCPGDTIVGEGTKIDNLVQIAHNVRIGKSCFIISQVGIAGSTVIEDGVVLAGQAGIVGHITIGAGARIGAQAGVTRDVKNGQIVSGYPAMNHREAKRINALIRNLPKLFKQVDSINKNLKKK